MIRTVQVQHEQSLVKFYSRAAVAVIEFVARIGRLAWRDGWRRRTTPSVNLDPPCRSRPMLIAGIISQSSGAG
jgi:hypothetical protein